MKTRGPAHRHTRGCRLAHLGDKGPGYEKSALPALCAGSALFLASVLVFEGRLGVDPARNGAESDVEPGAIGTGGHHFNFIAHLQHALSGRRGCRQRADGQPAHTNHRGRVVRLFQRLSE